MKRSVILGLIALVAATISLLAPGTASAAASWKVWQTDGDRCWDSTTMDANFNGNYEVALFDLDNDCRWDTKIWNSAYGARLRRVADVRHERGRALGDLAG